MTKKHFQQFAEMVKRLDLGRADREHVALMLADVLEQQSERFDRLRFLRECKVS